MGSVTNKMRQIRFRPELHPGPRCPPQSTPTASRPEPSGLCRTLPL